MPPRTPKQDPAVVIVSRIPIVEALAGDHYRRSHGPTAPEWRHVRGSLRKAYVDSVSSLTVSVVADLIREAVLEDRKNR